MAYINGEYVFIANIIVTTDKTQDQTTATLGNAMVGEMILGEG